MARITRTLIRLHGCAGWPASLLFACGIRQVFSWWGSLYKCSNFRCYSVFKKEQIWYICEPPRDKMACAPSDDSDQPGRISVFAVRMKKAQILSYPLSTQQRLWSDWADAQADLSLCWVHFVGFVMRRLICWCFHYLCIHIEHSDMTSFCTSNAYMAQTLLYTKKKNIYENSII